MQHFCVKIYLYCEGSQSKRNEHFVVKPGWNNKSVSWSVTLLCSGTISDGHSQDIQNSKIDPFDDLALK